MSGNRARTSLGFKKSNGVLSAGASHNNEATGRSLQSDVFPLRSHLTAMRSLSTLLLLLIILVSTGCATLFTGSSDNIVFESDPPGAEVLIDGLVIGRTPTTVNVKRPGMGDQQVTLRLDGYNPVTFTLSKSFNSVAILNLASFVGWGIDVLTGAVMKYDKRLYNVDMSRGSVSMRLDQLEQSPDGSYMIPDVQGELTIVDTQVGIGIVFEN